MIPDGTAAFRDQLIAAPLKLIVRERVVRMPNVFPRSIDRGSIEARVNAIAPTACRRLSAIN